MTTTDRARQMADKWGGAYLDYEASRAGFQVVLDARNEIAAILDVLVEAREQTIRFRRFAQAMGAKVPEHDPLIAKIDAIVEGK